jgi:hypothetical protein
MDWSVDFPPYSLPFSQMLYILHAIDKSSSRLQICHNFNADPDLDSAFSWLDPDLDLGACFFL